GRRAEAEHGHVVPGPDAPRAARAYPRQLGHDGEQPAGALLLDHACRQASSGDRKGKLGSDGLDHANAIQRPRLRSGAGSGENEMQYLETLREWILRIWGTFRHAPSDRELERELEFHLEMVEHDLRREGHSPRSAQIGRAHVSTPVTVKAAT